MHSRSLSPARLHGMAHASFARIQTHTAWAHHQWISLWQQTRRANASVASTHARPLLRALAVALLVVGILIIDAVIHILQLLPALGEYLSIATICISGLLFVRIAAAIQRWRLGNAELEELLETARLLVSLGCSFLACTSSSVDGHHHQQRKQAFFIGDLKRLALSYVALALQDCRGDGRGAPPVAQFAFLLEETELSTIIQQSSVALTNKRRAAVIELWLRCRVTRAGVAHEKNESVLLPHAVHVMELHRVVSCLPAVYQNLLKVWSDPPEWKYTRYAPHFVVVYLVMAAMARLQDPAAHGGKWTVPVVVCVYGLVLFGLDEMAVSIETRNFGGSDNHHQQQPDHLEMRLVEVQDEMNGCVYEFFRSMDSLGDYKRHDRNVVATPMQPRPRTRPRRRHWQWRWPRMSSPSLTPASSPSSAQRGDGDQDGSLSKPSLKQVLDTATLSSSSPRQVVSVDERQPLLSSGGSSNRGIASPPPPRRQPYTLFLRRHDDSDETDQDDDDDDAFIHV